MRITSGYLRSRLLQMPEGIRPTRDKVRKAIFDILGEIEGLSCCDFFAGSGAIGLEAISRGVKEAVFVENNHLCQRVIKQNIDSLQVNNCELIPLDTQAAIALLHKNKRIFDLIFMDPPYGEDAAKKALQSLEAHDIVSPDGLVIIEHFKNDDLPDNTGVLRLIKRSHYGNTIVSIYRRLS